MVSYQLTFTHKTQHGSYYLCLALLSSRGGQNGGVVNSRNRCCIPCGSGAVATRGKVGLGVAFFGYSLGNVGLYIAAK